MDSNGLSKYSDINADLSVGISGNTEPGCETTVLKKQFPVNKIHFTALQKTFVACHVDIPACDSESPVFKKGVLSDNINFSLPSGRIFSVRKEVNDKKPQCTSTLEAFYKVAGHLYYAENFYLKDLSY